MDEQLRALVFRRAGRRKAAVHMHKTPTAIW
jgi:hypothetical protein